MMNKNNILNCYCVKINYFFRETIVYFKFSVNFLPELICIRLLALFMWHCDMYEIASVKKKKKLYNLTSMHLILTWYV